MTNLAAAVERVRKDVNDARNADVATHTTFASTDDLETILAELGRGAGGEVAATLIHSPDELTRVDISMHGMGLGYGKHDLFTRPPVAGLAELTDAQIVCLYDAMNRAEILNMKRRENALGQMRGVDKAVIEAYREFLGKVE